MAASEGPMKNVEIIQDALGRLVKSESLTFTEAFEINATLRNKIKPGLPILTGLTKHYNPDNSCPSDCHVLVDQTRPARSYIASTTGGEEMVTELDSDTQGVVDYKSMGKETWVRDWIERLDMAPDAAFHDTESMDEESVDTQLAKIPTLDDVPVVTQPGEIHSAKKDLFWPKTEEQDPYDRLDLFCKTCDLSMDNKQDPYSSLDLFHKAFETPTVKFKAEDSTINYNVSAASSPDERKLPKSTKFEWRFETPKNQIGRVFYADHSHGVEKSVHQDDADSVFLGNEEQSDRSSGSVSPRSPQVA